MITIYTDEFVKFSSEQDLKRYLEILDNKKIAYTLKAGANPHQKVAGGKERKNAADKVSSPNELSQNSTTTLLLEDSDCTLYLRQKKRFSGYFLLKPKDLIDPKPALKKLKLLLAWLKQDGFSQYSLSYNQRDQSYLLMPSLTTSGNHVDINAKLINSIRSFFSDEALDSFEQLPTLDDYFKSRQNEHGISLKYPSKSVWLHIDKLEHNIHQTIDSFLQANGIIEIDALTASSLSSLSHTTEHSKTMGVEKKVQQEAREIGPALKTLTLNANPCAFCNPKIIKNQLILDLGHFLILVNFRPYVGSKVHFLLVPTHIEDWSDLALEELAHLQKIQTAILKSLQANFRINTGEMIAHVQNGVNAGQTVSGSHMHLVSRPSFLPFMVDLAYQMLGKSSPTLSPAEMASIAEKIKPELIQNLLLEAAPTRFSVDPIPTDMRVMLYSYKPRQELNTHHLSGYKSIKGQANDMGFKLSPFAQPTSP